MPTEIVHSIIPAGGGDYTSLSAWEAAQQRDLVSADEIEVAECQTGASTDLVTLAGWTTDATRYVIIRNASGHFHGGDRTAGFRMTSSTSQTIRIDALKCHVRGIVILPTANTPAIATLVTTSIALISHCIIYGGGVSTGRGVWGFAGTVLGWNNFIYGFKGASLGYGFSSIDGSGVVVRAYNNTIVDCRIGFARTAGTMVPKNNIVQDTSNVCFSGTMTSSQTNISSDATSPETGLRSIDLDFVDAANGNYHLAGTDTEAIGAGTDLSADADLPFSDDIDGGARAGGAWDIGADQAAAAAVYEQSDYRFYNDDGASLGAP